MRTVSIDQINHVSTIIVHHDGNGVKELAVRVYKDIVKYHVTYDSPSFGSSETFRSLEQAIASYNAL